MRIHSRPLHWYRVTRPPGSVRRARLDNLAVVPGNLLPYKDQWQVIANQLPQGAILIVLPSHNPTQKRALLAAAKVLAAEGHQVSIIPAAEVAHRRVRIQERLGI